MNLLNTAAEHWAAWLVAASWQLGLFVCLVDLVTRLARSTSPRFLHGLWLLVLVKVFLPTSLTTPLGVGHWGITPLVYQTTDRIGGPARQVGKSVGFDGVADEGQPSPSVAGVISLRVFLILWTAGGLFFITAVVWRYLRLVRTIDSSAAIDEGPVRVMLEQIAMDLEVEPVPDLVSTSSITSPFLFGVARPRIVLPENMLADLSEIELRAVLTHELAHWKRRDTWIGWLQVLAQAVFWFHPFLWWANRQLRHQRECVCDETVLHLGGVSPQCYGESVVRVLTASRGRSLAFGSLVGVFERGDQLQERLENIMNYTNDKRRFGWSSRLALAAFAIMFLPMAPAIPAAADTPTPQIVKTNPTQGATGVDPALKEITVTFDRDMSAGMSWTGAPPQFPPVDDSREARWINRRTCVLPVKLEKAAYYRVGINSTSHQNFRSVAKVAALPSAISFTTIGATKEIENQIREPEIVSLEPKNGATDVDPKTDQLKVTFNMPMGQGMSWTGGGPSFPKIPEGKKAAWSNDGLTCTLPVALEAGHDYQLGLNSQNLNNFQSKAGVPLKPVVYKFRTR